jgi:hypothetical protein
MAQAAGRGLQQMILEVASTYPAAVRYGGGYWSEMVGNVTGHVADMLEALVEVAKEPARSREVMTDLVGRTRQYLVASGSTFERMLLDFNQALVKLARACPESMSGPGHPAAAAGGDGVAQVFQRLADFAASEAMKIQASQGRPDLAALRQQLEACLTELRRLETPPAGASPQGDQPRPN